MTHNRLRWILLAFALTASALPYRARAALYAQENSAAPQASSAAAASAINQYCVTCHNPRLKTAGLVIDTQGLTRIGDNPEVWEKVLRKLRSTDMPPSTAPRPSEATYASLVSFLETELDRAAAAKPDVGTIPLLHRLTRTEYRNAIRDLLALDALPKEMDYELLLPADNVSSGFDNIADLLFVSPATMERYLAAAQKISRLAVGNPETPVMVNIHRLHPEQLQEERVEELPFGTRGGLAIHGYFPVNGEYAVKVEVAGAARDAQQIEITVDGERMELIPLGGGGGRGGGNRPLEFRIPIKAGPRLVGVTFIERSQVRGEETLRPRMRSRGTQPALASVTISGPYSVTGPGDTPSRQRIFVCQPASAADEAACAREILSTLARRAYRRPSLASSDEDVQRLWPFYVAGHREGGFERGIERALERILVSPQFLFRIETDPPNVKPGTVHELDEIEIASRLSFFIWSSIPDDELLDLAAAGRLKNPATLEQQVRRMMADPRSTSLVNNFAAQWLYLRDLESKDPDQLLFPNFDETLRSGLLKETELFLDSILRSDRSVLDLITANYTFLNERLAGHYGIPNVKGSHFRRVELPAGDPRGGLLGQGSILSVTSYSTRTSPVLRGKWVLENLLAAAPPPPPPDVPALKTEGAEPGKALTMREAMIQHRANPACSSCHARMDPIGFALENFDALGKWRQHDSFNRIDASGSLPDGRRFEGVAGLKEILVEDSEEFVTAVSEKLLMYGLGRNLQYYDAPAIRAIVREAARNNNTFSSLVLGVAKSPPFRMRAAH